MAIQADGKIVAAGHAFVSTNDFALVRYNADGTLDASFGIAGKVTTDFGNRDIAFAVATQADGQIVAAGSSEVTVSNRDFGAFALARYDGGFTPLDLTIALSARAQALVNAGIFNAGQGNSLNSKLAQAVRSLGRGEINTACNQLRAFINEINALITGGVLTSTQGQLLINAATGIRNRLGCR